MFGFPAAGWTLAVDVPGRRAMLTTLLDGLDDLVVEAGGRVYLSKDARLRAAHLPAMYPQLDHWREVRSTLDPHHVLRSDMDRRLDLSGCGSPRERRVTSRHEHGAVSDPRHAGSARVFRLRASRPARPTAGPGMRPAALPR